MAKIIMLKGLPASGKSTYAEKLCEKKNYIRLNDNDFKKTFFINGTPNKIIEKFKENFISDAIKENINVVIDDCNLNPINEKKYKELSHKLNCGFTINDSFLEIPVEECIKRDLSRKNSIGSRKIYDLFFKFVFKPVTQQLEENWDKKRAIIVDIDGTLALNESNRGWKEYSKVINDTPDPLVSLILDSIDDSTGGYYLDILLVTARKEDSREVTENWLKTNMIPYKRMYMRDNDDERSDWEVKCDIYNNDIEKEYCVLGVFDDRPKVCDMWRSLGLKVCQVSSHNVDF